MYPERPLLKTDDVTIHASISGTPVPAQAYSVAFVPMRTYVNIPSLTNALYAWFGINWEHNLVGASGRPYERIPRIRTVNKAGPIGVELRNPKIEDQWIVDARPNRLTFSNATIIVQVERQ